MSAIVQPSSRQDRQDYLDGEWEPWGSSHARVAPFDVCVCARLKEPYHHTSNPNYVGLLGTLYAFFLCYGNASTAPQLKGPAFLRLHVAP